MANFEPNFTILWFYDFKTYLESNPTINDIDGDGEIEIIIGSRTNNITIFNGSTGTIEWEFEAKNILITTPAIADINEDGIKEIIFGCYDKSVYAISGMDGTLIWNYTMGDILKESAPAIGDIDGDKNLEVVIGCVDNKVYALNGENGSLLWSYTTGDSITSSPALGDVDNDGFLEVIIGSNDHKVYALNGEDGSLLWSFTEDGQVESSPTIADINNDSLLEVVIGGGYQNHKLYVLYGLDGSLLWSKSVVSGGWVMYSSPSVGDINNDNILDVIVGSDGGYVYAFNGVNGDEIWSIYIGNDVDSSPLTINLDSDAELEVIIGNDYPNNLGYYSLKFIDNDGSILHSLDYTDEIVSTPAINDVNRDGFLDLVVCINNGTMIVYNLQITMENFGPCSKFRYDLFNSGFPFGDFDNDGLKNNEEYFYDVNDCDNDGLLDGAEVNIYFTDPNDWDTDDDGLSDGAEVNIYFTDPNDWDTDDDGLSDGSEVNIYFTDPNDSDTDNDGISDGEEIFSGYDPNNAWSYPSMVINIIIIIIIIIIFVGLGIVIFMSYRYTRKHREWKRAERKIWERERKEKERQEYEKEYYENIPNLKDLIRNYVYHQLKAIQNNFKNILLEDLDKKIKNQLNSEIKTFVNYLGLEGNPLNQNQIELLKNDCFTESKPILDELRILIKEHIEKERIREEREVQERILKEKIEMTQKLFGKEIIKDEDIRKVKKYKTIDEEIDDLMKEYATWERKEDKKKL